ncbi:hypothetical protein ACIF8T_32510 [Streptomyces sp. NPDC085946]|uniref:hypothetical protein n=1 Tax=Streptomyces sp. NPDC085946 TaxID=3365744 RepID=UPI0037D4013C
MLLSLRTRTAARAFPALATAALCLASAVPAASAEPARPRSVEVPAGVVAAVAVFDRQTGTFTEQLDTTRQFRAASVVKLLIALDHLWDRGPAYDIPSADRARLDAMLRSSDDTAANHYWAQNGQGAIVDRMAARLGLTHTARPPASHPGHWGYTALTAADTVRIYRYLLDSAPAPVRDYVMGNLRQSTRCGADGFDQHFGTAGAFDRPWAVKQGWSGFDSGGCTATASAAGAPVTTAGDLRTEGADGVDLVREALHTTGTVGTGDRSIVAVLTLHPDGTPYGKAYTDLGRLVRSLDVPGGVRPTGTWFGTWGSGVRVRALPTTESATLTTLPAGVEVLVGCQKRGRQVSVPPYTNDWWAYLPQYGGYITNIHISSPDNQLPGVRTC